jgi:hypothetical protein
VRRLHNGHGADKCTELGNRRYTNSLSELTTIDALAFVKVRFSFPNETRTPSLPVRASSGRGLIYPLTGSSWCTGPELIVALNQGASIEVLQGLRVDYVPNSPRPFEEFCMQNRSDPERCQVTG